MFWLAPVARREQPISVPKNQYSRAMTTTRNTEIITRGFFQKGMLLLPR